MTQVRTSVYKQYFYFSGIFDCSFWVCLLLSGWCQTHSTGYSTEWTRRRAVASHGMCQCSIIICLSFRLHTYSIFIDEGIRWHERYYDIRGNWVEKEWNCPSYAPYALIMEQAWLVYCHFCLKKFVIILFFP